MNFLDVKILDFPMDSNWVSGVVNNGQYYFQAKLFDVGSVYGIDEGRISKLCITRNNKNWLGEAIVNYDRDWDIFPKTDKDYQIFISVLEYLEQTPKRFEERENLIEKSKKTISEILKKYSY